MKKPLITFILGIIAVSLLDSLGAIASRQLDFNYSSLSVVSCIIYVAFAFMLARQTNKKSTIIVTGILGLYDATIGWRLSTLLGANTGEHDLEITITMVIMTAILMTIFACLLGLLGWWISNKILFDREKSLNR